VSHGRDTQQVNLAVALLLRIAGVRALMCAGFPAVLTEVFITFCIISRQESGFHLQTGQSRLLTSPYLLIIHVNLPISSIVTVGRFVS
jgi:hypothetical protein